MLAVLVLYLALDFARPLQGASPSHHVVRRAGKAMLHRHDEATREEARTAIFEYIEIFYNRQRLYQILGYLAPAEYERRAGVS